MTFPYIVENGADIRCLCKGCGLPLWRDFVDGQNVRTMAVAPEYGDLYVALLAADGTLSEHSTPCCPSCADRVIGQPLVSELEEWWGADVFHWFVEARCSGASPDDAYLKATQLQRGRHVVRALRYAPRG